MVILLISLCNLKKFNYLNFNIKFTKKLNCSLLFRYFILNFPINNIINKHYFILKNVFSIYHFS